MKKLVEEGVNTEASKKPLASFFRFKGKKTFPKLAQKKEKNLLTKEGGKSYEDTKIKSNQNQNR